MPLNDPLVPPAEWPGVDVSYRFRMAGGAPSLTLHLAFDPGQIAGDEDAALLAAVAARLADPDVALDLHTTVLPGKIALRPALAAFLEELRTGTLQRRETDLTFAVDPAGVAERADDLFQVRVRLTLGDSAAFGVPPAADWARDFEAAFAGFDGADGRLRVLAGADGPWALRWSRTAGVWAEFPRGEAAYFTFAPLSTRLMSGPAQVTRYDPATLEPERERTETFSSVDLDAWGRAFLEALDDLLSPGMAEAIARVDEPAYAELVRRREQMARSLSRRLVPVYAGGVPKVIEGDLEAARGEFEQALLDSLARAYSISAVVQVPASIQAAGEASTLRLFGSAGASASTLAPRDRYLTFMVPAEEPPATAYEIQYVGSQDAGTEWLELTGGLNLPLPRLDVPAVLRAFPAAPALAGQTASGPSEPGTRSGDPIRDVLWWDHTVELALPGIAAQDDLHVEVVYNPPAGAARPRTTDGSLPGLFAALAGFHTAWPALEPHLPRIADDAGEGPAARVVLAAAVAQAASVVDRWAALEEAPLFAADAGTDGLVIRFARARTASQLDVFSPRADEWPSINEQRPTAVLPADGGYRGSYPFSGGDTLTLRWPSLDLLTRRSARATFSVVRNAGLSDALVYRTAPVTFASPAFPSIVVDRLGPLPSGASLEEVLAQVLQAGTPALVRVSYEYPIGHVRVAVPLLETRGEIDARSLAEAITAWHASAGPPTDGALLCLQAEFGEVKLNRVEITVPPGWW